MPAGPSGTRRAVKELQGSKSSAPRHVCQAEIPFETKPHFSKSLPQQAAENSLG